MTTALDIVDGLVFAGESLFGGGVAPEALFADLDRAGVQASVVAPSRDPDYSSSAANDRVAALVAEAPHTRRQLGRIDPNHRGALDEVARCVEVHGVAGFFLSPREEVFPIASARVASAIEGIADAGVPLVVESGVPWVSEPLQIAIVAERHPELDIVMTNGGQFNISGLGQADAFEALERSPRLHIHTSGVYRQDFVEGAIARFGAGRVLFASGAPEYTPAYELLRVLGANCSDSDRATVIGGAARRLFW